MKISQLKNNNTDLKSAVSETDVSNRVTPDHVSNGGLIALYD